MPVCALSIPAPCTLHMHVHVLTHTLPDCCCRFKCPVQLVQQVVDNCHNGTAHSSTPWPANSLLPRRGLVLDYSTRPSNAVSLERSFARGRARAHAVCGRRRVRVREVRSGLAARPAAAAV